MLEERGNTPRWFHRRHQHKLAWKCHRAGGAQDGDHAFFERLAYCTQTRYAHRRYAARLRTTVIARLATWHSSIQRSGDSHAIIHDDSIAMKYWAAWSNIHYIAAWLPLAMRSQTPEASEQGQPPKTTEVERIQASLGQREFAF